MSVHRFIKWTTNILRKFLAIAVVSKPTSLYIGQNSYSRLAEYYGTIYGDEGCMHSPRVCVGLFRFKFSAHADFTLLLA